MCWTIATVELDSPGSIPQGNAWNGAARRERPLAGPFLSGITHHQRLPSWYELIFLYLAADEQELNFSALGGEFSDELSDVERGICENPDGTPLPAHTENGLRNRQFPLLYSYMHNSRIHNVARLFFFPPTDMNECCDGYRLKTATLLDWWSSRISCVATRLSEQRWLCSAGSSRG